MIQSSAIIPSDVQPQHRILHADIQLPKGSFCLDERGNFKCKHGLHAQEKIFQQILLFACIISYPYSFTILTAPGCWPAQASSSPNYLRQLFRCLIWRSSYISYPGGTQKEADVVDFSVNCIFIFTQASKLNLCYQACIYTVLFSEGTAHKSYRPSKHIFTSCMNHTTSRLYMSVCQAKCG